MSVACGASHTIVLCDSGQILACGLNGEGFSGVLEDVKTPNTDEGQLGLGDTRDRAALTALEGVGEKRFAVQVLLNRIRKVCLPVFSNNSDNIFARCMREVPAVSLFVEMARFGGVV